jgi:hypothetical protein
VWSGARAEDAGGAVDARARVARPRQE